MTDSRIRRLTQEEILGTINKKNVSGIFMKDFNFIDLLGNIKYGDNGDIIGRFIFFHEHLYDIVVVVSF